MVGVKNGYQEEYEVEYSEDYVNGGSTRGYHVDTSSNNLPYLVSKVLSKIKPPHDPKVRS